VEEEFMAGLTVAPNPTSGEVRVELKNGFVAQRIQAFDALGRPLAEWEAGEIRGTLDLSLWGSGVRYVTVTTTDGWSTTRRVVVQ
jgi:hypothetical protein